MLLRIEQSKKLILKNCWTNGCLADKRCRPEDSAKSQVHYGRSLFASLFGCLDSNQDYVVKAHSRGELRAAMNPASALAPAQACRYFACAATRIFVSSSQHYLHLQTITDRVYQQPFSRLRNLGRHGLKRSDSCKRYVSARSEPDSSPRLFFLWR